jgi:hypothetical protein
MQSGGGKVQGVSGIATQMAGGLLRQVFEIATLARGCWLWLWPVKVSGGRCGGQGQVPTRTRG